MKNLYFFENGVAGAKPPTGTRGGSPSNIAPFPGERLCMLGWLCIVQSLWAYTPGVRAGAECGATAPDQARMLAVSHTKPLHDAVAQMADDLYGGSAPKQGCFGCLPKVISKDAYVS